MKKEFFEASEENKLNYCKNTLKLEEPKILIAKIKMGTLLKVDGFLMYLQARQNDSLVFDNAVELKLDQENYNALKLVVKVYAQIMEYKKLKKVYEITEYDKITLEKTSSLYDQFMDKLLHSIYGKRLSKQGEQLKEKRENFLTLTLADQCITLIEILHFFQCNGVMSNLQSIGGKSKVGRLTLNKNISKNKEVKIIHKSVTGIFEQEVDLLSPCLGE